MELSYKENHVPVFAWLLLALEVGPLVVVGGALDCAGPLTVVGALDCAVPEV